jgi:hypothetical protein
MHVIRTLIAVLAAALLPGFGGTLAGEPSHTLDVLYDPEACTIGGTLDVVLPESPPTAYFLLLANLASEANPYLSQRAVDERYPHGFEPSSTEIVSVHLVQADEQTALPFRLLALPPTLQTYSLEETVLAVDLPDDTATTLQVRFITTVPRTSNGDEGVTRGVLTWRFGWFPLLLEDQRAIIERDGSVAYAGRDAFPLVLPWGNYEATVSAPAELEFLTGADRIEPLSVQTDEATLNRSFVRNDTPTRSLSIAFGTDYRRYTLDGQTPIVVAYLPGHDEEARLLATYARDILADLESRFGPYPRARLTIVENPNNQGTAFAADGIVWMSSRFFAHRDIPLAGFLNRIIEYVLAHEIAHQWFGIGTGVDLDADAWLSEGMAQYLAISYFEARYGGFEPNLINVEAAGIVEDFLDRQFGYLNLREHEVELPYLLALGAGFDEALMKPTMDVEYANANVVRLYDKGYLVARAIASAVGQDIFDSALRTAVETTRARRLETDELQAILERESGRSLQEIFSYWVFGAGSVDYAVHIASRRKTRAEYETTVVVSREGGTAQPVVVEATLVSGATVRQEWDGVEAEGTFVFRTPSSVSRVTVDPDHRLPDRDRLNNNSPVKIVGAVDRATLPLDAYVLAPDPQSGGFSFSYLDRLRVTVRPSSASALIVNGRHQRYAASASIAENQLTGELSYTYLAYAQPLVESPATYWEPDVAYTIGVHRLFSNGAPLLAFRLSALHLPSITHSGTRTVSLEYASTGTVRFFVAAFDERRVLPGFYVQGAVSLGFSFGETPDALRFEFDELRACPPDPSAHKLSGAVAVELPSAGDVPYNVLNLAMIDRSRARFFLSGGVGWTTPGDFSRTSPRVEAGVEQVMDLSTLGGLLPLSVRLGVAVPVIGDDETVFYIGISLQ